jgi:hypothetical protein
MTEPVSERIKNVFEWAHHQTSEDHKFNLEDYYWTQPVKDVLFDLKHTTRALLGIQGLQGTGKSAALRALAESFPEENIILWKWRRDWEQGFFDEVAGWDEYWERLWLAAADNEQIRRKLGLADLKMMSMELNLWKIASNELHETKTHLLSGERMTCKEVRRETIDARADMETLEKLLGASVVQGIKRGFLSSHLFKAKAVFIDMPDYNKTNLQLMSKDVDELQRMWIYFMEREWSKTSILVSVQKEIVMRKPHFFFGKVMWSALKPLTSEQLLEAYLQKWKSCEPFDEAALRLLAKLSRGVFRRFLKYVYLSIRAGAKTDLISIDDVEKVVSSDTLLGDMELELSDIFSNAQHRVQAVKVFEMLRAGSLTQKQIAENLGISEAVAGKFVAKLDLYGYVKRARGKEVGYGWNVSLL